MAKQSTSPVNYDTLFAGLEADGYTCDAQTKQDFKDLLDRSLSKYNVGSAGNPFEYGQSLPYMLLAFVQNFLARFGLCSENSITKNFGDVVSATAAQNDMHRVQLALSETYAKGRDKGMNPAFLEAALTTKFGKSDGDVINKPYSAFNQLAPSTGFAPNQSTSLDTRMAQLDVGELRVQSDLPRKAVTPALTGRS